MTSTHRPKRSSSCGRSSPSSGFIEPTSTNRAGWRWRDAVALDHVDARHGDVEQHVDEVVGEQVDLVDVQHPAVGGGQQAGLEADLAAGQGRPRCRACRRPGPRWRRAAARRTARRRAARRARGRAWSWPTPSGPAAARHRCSGSTAARQQRQLGVVLADDGAERERGALTAAPPSPRPRAPRRGASTGPRREASHMPRSSASSSRSAIDAAPTGSIARRTSGSARVGDVGRR